MELKKDNKYAIDGEKKLIKTNPEDVIKIQLISKLKNETNDLQREARKVNIHKLKDWNKISINQDIQGKTLMTGN